MRLSRIVLIVFLLQFCNSSLPPETDLVTSRELTYYRFPLLPARKSQTGAICAVEAGIAGASAGVAGFNRNCTKGIWKQVSGSWCEMPVSDRRSPPRSSTKDVRHKMVKPTPKRKSGAADDAEDGVEEDVVTEGGELASEELLPSPLFPLPF